MKIKELVKIVKGKVLTKNLDLNGDVAGGFAADLMSDVLTSIQPGSVLLTGLCHPQTVRTAQIADVSVIVLVRGKRPPAQLIAMAEGEGIVIITTKQGMFEACGRLYEAGMPSLE